ncbi:MAG: universal stress protein [Nitrosopumilaceae archaeon]
MLFKNILVPYDGSSHSKHAFKVALDMAKKYNSKLSMVTVLDTSSGYWVQTNLWDKALGGAKNLVTKDFESFKSAAKKAKVSFHSEIIESHSITKTIVSYSKSKKIDLIVMGAHGITGWDKLILGSVTDSVAHRVKCPVLIVR